MEIPLDTTGRGSTLATGAGAGTGAEAGAGTGAVATGWAIEGDCKGGDVGNAAGTVPDYLDFTG